MVANVFENIRKKDKNGNEFWNAKEVCRNNGQKIEEHFAHVSEMVPL